MCALRLASSGREVEVVYSDKEDFSLGSLDLFGYLDGNPVDNPEDAIKNLPDEHPYSLVGIEQVKKALDFFVEMSRRAGIPFDGKLSKNVLIPTGYGTVKLTCMAPEEVYRARVEAWAGKKVGVSGSREREYSPRFVAESLRFFCSRLGIEVEISEGEGEIILSPFREGGNLLMPGDGNLILERLGRLARELGVRFTRDKIREAEFRGKNLVEVRGAKSYTAELFVVARELEALNFDTSEKGGWKKTPLPEKGHPGVFSGILVDENLRPLRAGNIVENVRVIGMPLAGYEPCAEKSAWGVGIVTGYIAGGE